MLATIAIRVRTEVADHRIPSAALGVALAVFAVLTRGLAADTAAFVVLAIACGPLVVIDARTHRLPDAITGPTAVAGLLLLTLAVSWGEPTIADLGRAILGGLILCASYLALALISPGGLGLGDVKLAGILGLYLAWCGWETWLLGTFAAFTLGGVWALALIALRRAGRRTAIAFGPYMIAGACVAITLNSNGRTGF